MMMNTEEVNEQQRSRNRRSLGGQHPVVLFRMNTLRHTWLLVTNSEPKHETDESDGHAK